MADRHPSQGTALITGATSGIGSYLADLFAKDGYDLVLVSRSDPALRARSRELEQTHHVSVKFIAKDLAIPSTPQEVFNELEKAAIQVDVLVNNAGIGLFGPFAKTDLLSERKMMQLNIVTVTHLTKLFLPGMLRKGTGKILNVASTAGFQPGPLMAVYNASKAYVLSFSEALAEELRGTGVSVTALCPGPTASGFQKAAGMEPSPIIKGTLVSSAKAVAEEGYRGLMAGKRLVIPGFTNKIASMGYRVLPRKTIVRFVRKLRAGRTRSSAV